MAKKAKKAARKTAKAVRKTAKPAKKPAPRARDPQVEVRDAAVALARARENLAKATFRLQAERGKGGGGCFGSCDGYGFGLGFDHERGPCGPKAAHVFSDKAQKQAKDDLQATSDAACRLGGADCTCKGGTMVEDRRTVSTFEVISGEKAGTWCQYGLWLRMEGGTCQ